MKVILNIINCIGSPLIKVDKNKDVDFESSPIVIDTEQLNDLLTKKESLKMMNKNSKQNIEIKNKEKLTPDSFQICNSQKGRRNPKRNSSMYTGKKVTKKLLDNKSQFLHSDKKVTKITEIKTVIKIKTTDEDIITDDNNELVPFESDKIVNLDLKPTFEFREINKLILKLGNKYESVLKNRTRRNVAEKRLYKVPEPTSKILENFNASPTKILLKTPERSEVTDEDELNMSPIPLKVVNRLSLFPSSFVTPQVKKSKKMKLFKNKSDRSVQLTSTNNSIDFKDSIEKSIEVAARRSKLSNQHMIGKLVKSNYLI